MKMGKKIKLGIVGHGFVGKATDWGFNKNVNKFIVDPLLNNSIEDLGSCVVHIMERYAYECAEYRVNISSFTRLNLLRENLNLIKDIMSLL